MTNSSDTPGIEAGDGGHDVGRDPRKMMRGELPGDRPSPHLAARRAPSALYRLLRREPA